MDEYQKSKSSWWQSLPGVLTAVAATATAIAGLVGALHQAGLFGNGNENKAAIIKKNITPTKANDETQPTEQSCSDSAGYPLGRWSVGARNAPNALSADFSTFITFTTSTSGTWLPYNGKGGFTASIAPAPGEAVVIILSVESGTYKSENQLVVSPDGCRMTGTFNDSENHRGEAIYQWQGVL